MKPAEQFFLHIPLPFSKWVYNITRQFIFKDIRYEGYRKIAGMIRKNSVEGDYLEFGVYKGTSLIQFYNLFKKSGLNDIRLFAFDAFQGLPGSEGNTFQKGEFFFPKKSFIRRIKKAGVNPERVIIVEGFFNESLTAEVKKQHGLSKAAVIHVDCDLYESTTDVLRFCQELVQEGTVLIFDDYLSFQNETDPTQYGEEKAFKEWKLFPLFEEIYEIGVSKAFVCKSR
jgi:O-methyltransferase